MTTYSLDLTAALAVPLALTFHDWEETDDGQPHVDPVGLLEALRTHAERLTILCQAGEIAVPAPQRNVFAFLEPAVIPVTAPLGGVFHPKLWILRYEPDRGEGPIRYRVLCASRNLTFDRSWDVLLDLEGRLGGRGRAEHGPLAHFVGGLRALAAETNVPLAEHRAAAIERIELEIARVELDPPDGISEIRFHPLGLEEAARDPIDGRRDRMLVISPFLGAGRLTDLSPGAESVLVSSQAELDALEPSALDSFRSIHVLTDLADPEPLDDGDASTPEASDAGLLLADSAEGLLRGLHAKVYAADAGHTGRLWVGSANATSAAFSTNVELLVELTGTKRRCGVDALLGDEEGGLRTLLEPYRRSDDPVFDEAEGEAEHLADAAAHALGAARLELHVIPAQDRAEGSRKLALELVAPAGLPDELGAVEARAWPITLSADRSHPLRKEQIAECQWEPLDVEQLTAFLAVALSVRVGVVRVERRVSVRTLLRGTPGDRDGAIVRSILSSPERLLRYLAFLLADLDDPATAIGMIGILGGEPDGVDPGGAVGHLDLPLFEGLVHALARDPERIDRVERLIGELAATEAGRDLLPPGLERIFEPIRAARERLGGAR